MDCGILVVQWRTGCAFDDAAAGEDGHIVHVPAHHHRNHPLRYTAAAAVVVAAAAERLPAKKSGLPAATHPWDVAVAAAVDILCLRRRHLVHHLVHHLCLLDNVIVAVVAATWFDQSYRRSKKWDVSAVLKYGRKIEISPTSHEPKPHANSMFTLPLSR